jgi:hypothetical protein
LSPLNDLILLGSDLATEIMMRREAGHINAIAGLVVFPAMVDAADAALLVAT